MTAIEQKQMRATSGACRGVDRTRCFLERIDPHLGSLAGDRERRAFLKRQLEGWEYRYARFIATQGASEFSASTKIRRTPLIFCSPSPGLPRAPARWGARIGSAAFFLPPPRVKAWIGGNWRRLGMGKFLATAAFATALIAVAASEASAQTFVCQAVGLRSVAYGRAFFVGDAKWIALSRCARRSGLCTISYCVPG